MTKYFLNTSSVLNLYKKDSLKSEIVTQLIYGEGFSILKRSKGWFKIKIKDDNYIGYIKKNNYKDYVRPTHKVAKLSAKIFKTLNKKKIGLLSFGSRIKVEEEKNKFLRFEKGWINKDEVKPISFFQKDLFNKIRIFRNIRYKWGGKSFKGLDCSALIQIFFQFNNRFCPRDAKDQVKYFKKNVKLKNLRKNDIIFWKGHVAVALSKKDLIHAYGPLKKTVIMNTKKTMTRIEKTVGLKVIGIKRI